MRVLVAGTALVLLAATGPPASPATAAALAGGSDNPLEQARIAAERLSFNGLVEVTWSDAGGSHSDAVFVQAAAGALEVRGETTLMAEGDQSRLVRRQGGEWDLLWSGSLRSPGRPDASAKYQLAAVGHAATAGRPTSVNEVREGTAVRERLYLDDQTGLLMKREQLDATGSPERVVGFVTFSLDEATPTPQPPSTPVDRSARLMSPTDLSSSFPAPVSLDQGYQRVGIFGEQGVVHVLYSDGFYDLSVFEQRGRLDGRDVPSAGRQVVVGGRRGWAYAWPGGHLLLWHAGHTTYTVVSDAPIDHLVAAARSLPVANPPSSLVDRLRRACRALVAPLG